MLEEMSLGLCASVELLEMLVEQGVPEEKLILHRVGVDVERFHPLEKPKGELHVIMIGRFVEKKGLGVGLRAFARAARGQNARLTIVGDGPLRSRLKELVSAEGIEAQVDFSGVLTSEQVQTKLAKAHVLLAPSCTAADGDRESGLVVVKEASACETVPVTTWHGGIPSIVDDGETGFLTPERNVDAVAERLSMLMADAPLRQRLGAAAREKMCREFDNRRRVEILEEHYDRVVSEA